MSNNTERYGLLIDYEYCSGCHVCEVACKKEHDLTVGQWGIKIHQDGPRQLDNGRWEYTYIPVPTSLCDLCADRVKGGKLPNCVHHCQAGVMVYGKISELAEKVDKDTMAIFSR
ncbi:oxidoreductase [Dehalobacter sp. DCM]|uniref:4Fe-4S dicluster domain-containing protein n=1 Tax=Dehalobacter sp. DCM TaxID=2907827 RepID=UPI003081A39A|nr:oxidoreductase [Dehalobacter sp. DCM]